MQRTVSPDIVRLIGNTPLLRVKLFERDFPRVEVYAKAEWFNPGGSVKDRAALSMIEDGERTGALTHRKTIIDSTSGNTGIAYALVGAAKGYRVKLVMPGNVSAERKALVTAYGAGMRASQTRSGAARPSPLTTWRARSPAPKVCWSDTRAARRFGPCGAWPRPSARAWSSPSSPTRATAICQPASTGANENRPEGVRGDPGAWRRGLPR